MTDLTKKEQKIEAWINDKYYGSLATTAATNVSYLNTTVAWAISLLTAAIALVLSHSGFPDKTSIVALAVLLIVMGHFFVRACKGYTNMMRFTTLEKLVIKAIIEGRSSLETIEDIRTYHVDWYNMLNKRKVAFKALSELGFGYFFMIVAGILVWTLRQSSPDWGICFGQPFASQMFCYLNNADAQMFLVVVAALLICAFEIVWMFWRSPYFRRAKIQAIAQAQK